MSSAAHAARDLKAGPAAAAAGLAQLDLPDIVVENKTDAIAYVYIGYLGCKNDQFTVQPNSKSAPIRRNKCLVTKVRSSMDNGKGTESAKEYRSPGSPSASWTIKKEGSKYKIV